MSESPVQQVSGGVMRCDNAAADDCQTQEVLVRRPCEARGSVRGLSRVAQRHEPGDAGENLLEKLLRWGHLGHLQGDVVRMAHDLRPDFDQNCSEASSVTSASPVTEARADKGTSPDHRAKRRAAGPPRCLRSVGRRAASSPGLTCLPGSTARSCRTRCRSTPRCGPGS